MNDLYNVLLNNILPLAILLAIAYVLYRILFFVLGCFFKKHLLKELRLPVLFLFLEGAFWGGLNFGNFTERGRQGLHHFLTVLLIATVGWLLIKLIAVCEKKLRDFNEQSSYLTRAKIFYRILVFLIAILTFASILMTFPVIRSLGIGILGSAGIAGIALGIAARPILLNLMAGFQIAFTKILKIGDHVVIEKEQGVIEEIYLTHVILKTSDLRRLLFPISYFIDKPFENWDRVSEELIAYIYIYCDYTMAIDKIRQRLAEILQGTSLWNKKEYEVHVTGYTEQGVEVRISISAENATNAFALRCHICEEILKFLQKEHPQGFPHQRHLYVS